MYSGIKILAPIIPFSENDVYPTHYSEFGAGGFRSVSSVSSRNSISIYKQEIGMIVYVIEDNTFYTLISKSDTLSNSNWAETKFEKNTVNSLNSLTGDINVIGVGDAICYNSGQTIILEVHAGSGDFVGRDETGIFAVKTDLDDYLLLTETGNFVSVSVFEENLSNYYLKSNPSGFVTINDLGGSNFVKTLNGLVGNLKISGQNDIEIFNSGDTIYISASLVSGDFVLKSETGNFATPSDIENAINDFSLFANAEFYKSSNPSGFLTSKDFSGEFVTRSETGIFLELIEDYSGFAKDEFYPKANPSGFLTISDINNIDIVRSINGVYGDIIFTGGENINIISSGQSIIISTNQVSGNYVLKSETGIFATNNDLISLINSYSGFANNEYYPNSNPNNYITLNDLPENLGGVESVNGLSGIINVVGAGDIAIYDSGNSIFISGKFFSGDFLTKDETGVFASKILFDNFQTYSYNNFYLKSNPSGFLTSVNGILRSETGQFANRNDIYSRLYDSGNYLVDLNFDLSGWITSNYITESQVYNDYYPRDNPSGFLYTGNIDIAVENNKQVALNTAHRLTFSGNPHGVTYTDVGAAIAYWNAAQIRGKDIDTSINGGLKHLQILKFDAFSNKFINTSLFSQQEDIKQTIYSAPTIFLTYDSVSLNAALTNISSSSPVSIVFSSGENDYYTSITSKSDDWEWTNLYDNSTNYLYIERSLTNSSISYGFTNIAPHYSTFAPENPVTYQTWFDSLNYIHYIWYNNQWTELGSYNNNLRLYVGEAYTSGSIATGVLQYEIGFSYSMDASNVNFDIYKSVLSLNVQDAIEYLEDSKINRTGDSLGGEFYFSGLLKSDIPNSDSEVANKKYVDDISTGLYTFITGISTGLYDLIIDNEQYLDNKLEQSISGLSGVLTDHINYLENVSFANLSGNAYDYCATLSGQLYYYTESLVEETQDDLDSLTNLVYKIKKTADSFSGSSSSFDPSLIYQSSGYLSNEISSLSSDVETTQDDLDSLTNLVYKMKKTLDTLTTG